MNLTPTHIAIIHNHFEPGEVTDVVCDQIKCLYSNAAKSQGKIGKIVLISASGASSLSNSALDHAEAVQIRDLDHSIGDESSSSQPTSRLAGFRPVASGQASLAGRDLFERVDAALRRAGLHPGNSIIHWHNHSLGRNAAAPFVVSHLANRGWRLLLQIHDLDADQNPAKIRHLLAQTGATRASTLDAIRYPVHENIAYTSSIATDRESLPAYAIMTTYVPTISAIVRTPPGDRASREAAVEEILGTGPTSPPPEPSDR